MVLRYCLDRLVQAGARLAEPGEFTLRAFLNGRIDLPRAEAVRDLIEATTLYQARVAARQTQGAVSKRVAPFKAQLLDLIALMEAGIDFAEDDVSVAPAGEITGRIEPIVAGIDRLARSFIYGSVVRSGFSLAIVGPPNAGKSSLFNRLLEQDRAIVTEIPGTTRDLVSETAEFAGIPVRLVDTAGIRETGELVERLGIERSLEAMSDADITLVIFDGSILSDSELLERARSQGRIIAVANKSDLPGFTACEGELTVSAVTGEGIHDLRNAVVEMLGGSAEMQAETGKFPVADRLAEVRGPMPSAPPSRPSGRRRRRARRRSSRDPPAPLGRAPPSAGRIRAANARSSFSAPGRSTAATRSNCARRITPSTPGKRFSRARSLAIAASSGSRVGMPVTGWRLARRCRTNSSRVEMVFMSVIIRSTSSAGASFCASPPASAGAGAGAERDGRDRHQQGAQRQQGDEAHRQRAGHQRRQLPASGEVLRPEGQSDNQRRRQRRRRDREDQRFGSKRELGDRQQSAGDAGSFHKE